MQRYEAQLSAQLHRASLATLAKVLDAFARLRYKPSAVWRARLRSVLVSRLQRKPASGPEAARLLSLVGRQFWWRGAAPVKGLMAAVARDLPACSIRDINGALMGAFRLCKHMRRGWVRGLVLRAKEQLGDHRASGDDVTALLQAPRILNRLHSRQRSSAAVDGAAARGSKAHLQASAAAAGAPIGSAADQEKGPQTLHDRSLDGAAQLQQRTGGGALLTAAEVDAVVREALAAAQPRLRGLSTGGLVALMRALADLRHRPSTDWMADAYLASHRSFPHFTGRQLARLLQSMVRLRLQLPRRWVQQLYSVLPYRYAADMAPADRAVTLWALASLEGLKPSEAWMQQLLSCHSDGFDRYGARSLATSIWALAKLGYRPPFSWGTQFLAASQERMQQLDPQSAAMLCYGLSVLHIRPSKPWVATFCARVAQLPPSAMSPQAACMIAGAAAALRWSEAAPLVQSWLTGLVGEAWLRSAQPADVCKLLCSCARLRCQPGPSWLGAFFSATSGGVLFLLSGPSLVALSWALAELQVPCPADWLQQLELALGSKEAEHDASHTATLLRSLPRLHALQRRTAAGSTGGSKSCGSLCYTVVRMLPSEQRG